MHEEIGPVPSSPPHIAGPRPALALLWGTLAVGLVDILDAFVFFGIRGTPPSRILQSIASGLLGRDAYAGGASTAALGAALHFFIAFCVAGTYLLASRRFEALARRPFLFGPLYGLAVYTVMYAVVIPLSAAGFGPRPVPVVINGVLIHLLGVGPAAALAARTAARPVARP